MFCRWALKYPEVSFSILKTVIFGEAQLSASMILQLKVAANMNWLINTAKKINPAEIKKDSPVVLTAFFLQAKKLNIPGLLDWVVLVRSWVDKDFIRKSNLIIKNLCILNLFFM